MGEVYRARDGKLDREVAIKVLPDVMARDPDRVARFQREAKLLAALTAFSGCSSSSQPAAPASFAPGRVML